MSFEWYELELEFDMIGDAWTWYYKNELSQTR